LAALAAITGCGRPAGGPGATETGRLEIREPVVTLTGASAAAYFTVVNPGRQGDRLLRVETAAARRAETHESVEEDGMVRMVARPEGFAVPAGGTLELAPGGKHVMLVEPLAPEAGAETVRLTLHFERAGAVEVEAALQRVGGMDHSGHAMGDHEPGANSDAEPTTDHGGHLDHDHGAGS
jgi:copper(I)-binding protein